MELKSIHIKNFRSVEDSENFKVDHVTCLVGKNEAGKTAILQALAALNPHPATPMKLDKVRDYPRRFLTQYDQRNPDRGAVAIEAHWEIEEKDILRVEGGFGPDIFTKQTLTISRRYNADKTEWVIPVNQEKIVDHLIKETRACRQLVYSMISSHKNRHGRLCDARPAHIKK